MAWAARNVRSSVRAVLLCIVAGCWGLWEAFFVGEQ